jgi:ketosteroid isomerase-like protein
MTELNGSALDRPAGGPAELVKALHRATNEHDLEAIVACFSADYRNETPAHPARGFVGREQVRRNWTQILAAVPNLTADVLRCSVDADTAWTEWEHRGTRRDGSAHRMRGVIIFGVSDGRANWARFYLEPVDEAPTDVNAAVRHQLRGGAA